MDRNKSLHRSGRELVLKSLVVTLERSGEALLLTGAHFVTARLSRADLEVRPALSVAIASIE